MARQLVLQDNGGAVIAEMVVVLETVDAGTQGRQYRGKSRQPDIYAQVYAAFFGGGIEMGAAAVNDAAVSRKSALAKAGLPAVRSKRQTVGAFRSRGSTGPMAAAWACSIAIRETSGITSVYGRQR